MSETIVLCFCDSSDIEAIIDCRWRNVASVKEVDDSGMGNLELGQTLYTCDHGGKALCEPAVCPVPELNALVNGVET